MTRILIAAGQKIFSNALAKLLAVDPNFQVLEIWPDADAIIAFACCDQPAIILMDENNDPAKAILTAKKIMGFTKAKLVAMSAYLDVCYANNMLRLGATGYLTRMAPAAEVLEAVREVARGNVYVCNESKGLVNTTPSPYLLIGKQQQPQRSFQPKHRYPSNHWHGILQYRN